jgi:hypothetical protein
VWQAVPARTNAKVGAANSLSFLIPMVICYLHYADYLVSLPSAGIAKRNAQIYESYSAPI